MQDDDEHLIRTTSNSESLHDEGAQSLDVDLMTILHHGEVQTAGSMFRRRVQYLVLTNTHLLRFKNQSKASEVFPALPISIGRTSSVNHARMSSGSSVQDSHHTVDPNTSIPLHNVVAVYKLDDGRPYFTLELAHYDEQTNQVSTISLQMNDPRESELWLTSIRAAITKARLTTGVPFGQQAVEYAARALEYESDYDPGHFRMFTVVQRASKPGGRSSTDDLGKLLSSVCYLVIGFHKIHLVPLPRPSRTASNTSIHDLNSSSYGIMNLSSVFLQSLEDSFQLSFRTPFQQQNPLHLASSSVNDIILCIRQAADFLRPTWLEQPFTWTVPQSLDDALLPVPTEEADHLCFDRTLTAYCVSYNIDPSNIRYTVNYECEDAPEFALLEPNTSRRSKYTALELLAILRALRYNESFHSISFRNVNIDTLHGVYDRQGSEHFMWKTKSGQPIKLPRLDQTPLIVQELQCLALKSSRLRRLDFTNCLSRRAKDLDESSDPSSGICEAIFPLCALQLTNVDWVTLDGIALSEIDIEYLFAAAVKKSCHFRAIELGRCSLTEETLSIAIQSMANQEDTLESFSISGNPARLGADALNRHLLPFKRVRRLNLSKVLLTSGPDPVLSLDVLLKWRLEVLYLSGTYLNTESVDSLSAYLMSEQSNTLRELHMEQCKMTGEDVATLMESMSSGRSAPRVLHLFVSENRLERQHYKLAKAIARSITPSHLTMRMLEYSKEQNFRDLIEALGRNTSLQYLDISRVSLPLDAGEETCERLKAMFESNSTLQELNISGEQAHLEAVTLGRGLPSALRGLEKNNALRVLCVEHQVLGLPGASALASVLERNAVLREIHCDNNDISLQAFTTLVNGVKSNNTLLHLSEMTGDRAWSRSKVDREVSTLLSSAPIHQSTSTKSTVRRAFGGAIPNSRSFSSRSFDKHAPAGGVTEQDVQAAVASLDQTWTAEKERLQSYLKRNYCLATDTPLHEWSQASSNSRPVTAASLATALKNASLDRTPTAELDRQLVGDSGHFSMDGLESDASPEETDGFDGLQGDDQGLVMGGGHV